MKFNYIKKGIIPALAVMLSLSSCLKDKNVDQDFSAINKSFIGIADASPSSSSTNSTGAAVVSSDAEFTLNLRLTYIGQDVSPGTAVTIKIETDSAKIVGPLNAARGTNYYTLKPENYSLPNTTITIPAGQKSIAFPVVIKPNTIAKTDVSYALPISVTDASGVAISDNYGNHVILVSIKNQYDGIYNATGTFNHPTGGIRPIEEEKPLATLNPHAVTSSLGDLGPDYVVTLDVDPATNAVTVTSADFDLSVPAGKSNTYDPATKTFHLNYQYSGAGGFRIIQEDLVYDRGR